MSSVVHLCRRTWLSLSDGRLRAGDVDEVRSVLVDNEFRLWNQMAEVDRRHSVRVLRRFNERLGDATRDERAAVLLHDVGKSAAPIGTLRRILVTSGIDRSDTGRRYRRHEVLGIEMLVSAGVDPAVVGCLRGDCRKEFLDAFGSADDE